MNKTYLAREVKMTQGDLEKTGCRTWFQFMKKAAQLIPGATFETEVKFEVSKIALRADAPVAPIILVTTFGEVVFNAMQEIQSRVPTENDFRTFQRMNQLTFSTSREFQEEVTKLEKKIGFFALGY